VKAIGRPGAALIAIVLCLGSGSVVEAQKPIRIGASLSQTGAYAALGQNQQRGYQLCVKHTNEKGGVLGRKLELVVYDDWSDPATAVRLYEKLVTQDTVDLLLGPYGSPITDAVADVAEKYKQPLVTHAATTSIFRKGRKFVFMLFPPAEIYLEGLFDIAVKRGLKTVAVLHEDTLFAKAVADGAAELAKKRGLEVVGVHGYPKGNVDFSTILGKVRGVNPDVLAAATYFDDAVAITRQLKQSNVNPRMYAVTVGGDLPKFYEILGKDAEFVYGPSLWDPELVTLRAGGLVPIARQYPGAREFVESHRKEFPRADLSYQTAAGYAICQILVEAVKRSGAVDGARIREAILKMDLNTVFGPFKVDQDGFQIAHKMLLFQWQNGRKVFLWPEELAPGKPRFPTPSWSQRQ
jgi:branched-chain amino acid transport system substrate-binding protein